MICLYDIMRHGILCFILVKQEREMSGVGDVRWSGISKPVCDGTREIELMVPDFR